jgi:hypothetical protein
MSIRPAVILLLLASLLGRPCLAKDAKVGQTSVTLTAPSGQCELDPGQPSDARMLQITESTLASVGNRLLGFYADCKQLNDWRTGKRALLEDFAQYQTSIAAIDAPAPAVPAEAIKQLCSQQREASEKVVTGIATDMKARIEEAVRGVQLNQVRSLGVVAEDANACYAALVQRFKAETGKDVTIMALFATTFVQGKLVLYYLYSPYRSAQTMPALLAKQKLNVAALLAANP